MKKIFRHIKEHLPCYLLAVSLLLSSIAFSGYTGHSRCGLAGTEQVEWPQCKPRSAQRVCSWKNAVRFVAACRPENARTANQPIPPSGFDRQVKVRLIACKAATVSFPRPRGFFQKKTIPSATDEDFRLL